MYPNTYNQNDLNEKLKYEIIKISTILTKQLFSIYRFTICDMWVPLAMAWWAHPQIAGGGKAFNMEGSCEYIE